MVRTSLVNRRSRCPGRPPYGLLPTQLSARNGTLVNNRCPGGGRGSGVAATDGDGRDRWQTATNGLFLCLFLGDIGGVGCRVNDVLLGRTSSAGVIEDVIRSRGQRFLPFLTIPKVLRIVFFSGGRFNLSDQVDRFLHFGLVELTFHKNEYLRT